MIFATAGTQLPFDRLLSGIDSWAARNSGFPILAQAGASQRRFHHIRTVPHLDQTEFQVEFEKARLIVAHAGMGTILSAAELGKPLIIMPRCVKFNEHRNDHQRDTAREMSRLSNVTVVSDGQALHEALDNAVSSGFEIPRQTAPSRPEELSPLIEAIRNFIWTEEKKIPARRVLFRKSAA